MRQRVALAAALAQDPDVLIADEPSTALDVTTQAEILQLLKDVQMARGMGLVLITHDLRVAFSVCDRIHVLYAGSLLEAGPAHALESEPLHPYSLGLLLSEPAADRRQAMLTAIEGSVPSPAEVAGSCSFAPRCRWAADRCVAAKPPLHEVEPGRLTACIRLDEIRGEMAELRDAARVRQPVVAAAHLTRDPLVRIAELHKVFRDRSGRDVHAVARRLDRDRPQRERGPRRRVGLGEDDARPLSRRARATDIRERPDRRHRRGRPRQAFRAASRRRCGGRCRSSSRIRTRRSTRCRPSGRRCARSSASTGTRRTPRTSASTSC